MATIEIFKHVGYWCQKRSQVFTEKRDHRMCKEYPAKIRYLSGTLKLLCTCPCHKKRKRKKK